MLYIYTLYDFKCCSKEQLLRLGQSAFEKTASMEICSLLFKDPLIC